MIQSMTGYGEAQRESEGHLFHFELRSVNNRYLKTSIRLPEDYAFLEPELEALLRRRLSRGSVTGRLYVRDASADAAHDINVAAIRRYVTQLRLALADDAAVSLDLATLAQLPGVCQPREMTDEQRERTWQLVAELTGQALERLGEMRRREGTALAEDLRKNCATIRARVDAIRALAPRVVADYRDRLLARVRTLVAESGVTLAAEDLIREVAVYADRSDISEELSRLGSHLDQFDACLNDPEPAGRKLEFIAQEMLREANTMGSKAGDAEIARHTIDVKSAVDRIKEQVANVE